MIVIKEANENNLKNVSLSLPKNKLIVFSGVSGSGKSTLAMEVLQHECQRQYMESLGMSAELRNKTNVKSIEGLSPAISITQSSFNNNPRSTVGTVTDISNYIRLLYSKIGERKCRNCGTIIYQNNISNDKNKNEKKINNVDFYEEMIKCPNCGEYVINITLNHFSFNKPHGACRTCNGIGSVNYPDVDKILDKNKSIRDFGVFGWDQVYIDRYGTSFINAGKHYGIDVNIDIPIGHFDETQMNLLLYGVESDYIIEKFKSVKTPKTVLEGKFEGIITNLMRRYSETTSQSGKQKIEKLLIKQECPDCNGNRFRREILDVTICGLNILEVQSLPLNKLSLWLKNLKDNFINSSQKVEIELIEDILRRVERIIDVGAEYLKLNQNSDSLSTGEWQRIKLARILDSNLTGVLYIIDEPTAGLHYKDSFKIISTLKKLRDIGNTVIVIEHDMEVIKNADYLVDFGPGAGRQGGKIVYSGEIKDIIKAENSFTGKYIYESTYNLIRQKQKPVQKFIKLCNHHKNNIKDINVDIPLERFVVITGVSGSGKTSLVFGILAKSAEEYFESGKNKNIGFEHIDNVVEINQNAIGRSTRSNPATYIDLFSDLRDLFASLDEAQKNNILSRDFSYNSGEGRCDNCQGMGKIIVPMYFIPDEEEICPVCQGKRYKKKILDVKYRGYNISDILELSVDEVIEIFKDKKEIYSKLKILQDIGLGYLVLGQSTSTLSGGEAQRLKLAKELTNRSSRKTLYLFDEPTNGLHIHDVRKLIDVFDRLVKEGNSIIIIEHNENIIIEADWIIDLGPDGGESGGKVIAQGELTEIMNIKNSYTGQLVSTLYNRLR